ncbi:MAG TPA: hypothetical protein VH440_12210 [Candidatus Limnocylindrales bacterium]|jgi:hypothetical protein
MDPRPALVPTLHTLLASAVGVLAVIGLFGTGSTDSSGGAGVTVVGGAQFAAFLVLPLVGIVMFGLWDWQMGRGAWILRAADVAVFALAALELSLGTTGFGRWLAGGMAILAASGVAASIVVERPRRAGFRR